MATARAHKIRLRISNNDGFMVTGKQYQFQEVHYCVLLLIIYYI